MDLLQVGAFTVLKELVGVLPDCLADHIGSLIPGIEKALSVSKSWCFFEFLLGRFLILYSDDVSICLYGTFSSFLPFDRINQLHRT